MEGATLRNEAGSAMDDPQGTVEDVARRQDGLLQDLVLPQATLHSTLTEASGGQFGRVSSRKAPHSDHLSICKHIGK